jgi:hypothetical protein
MPSWFTCVNLTLTRPKFQEQWEKNMYIAAICHGRTTCWHGRVFVFRKTISLQI